MRFLKFIPFAKTHESLEIFMQAKTFFIFIVSALFLVGCGSSKPIQLLTADDLGSELNEAATSGDVAKAQDALSLGADVNWANTKWTTNTPLFWAARHGHANVVALLLRQQDVDVNNTGKFSSGCSGDTPLHVAARFNHIDVVQLLIQDSRVDLEKVNLLSETPAQATRSDEIRALIQKAIEARRLRRQSNQ
jgi:hypothetical protein